MVQTYSASTVAADPPLSNHALPSIHNQDLMLGCNFILDLDGMFEVQHTERNTSTRWYLKTYIW